MSYPAQKWLADKGGMSFKGPCQIFLLMAIVILATANSPATASADVGYRCNSIDFGFGSNDSTSVGGSATASSCSRLSDNVAVQVQLGTMSFDIGDTAGKCPISMTAPMSVTTSDGQAFVVPIILTIASAQQYIEFPDSGVDDAEGTLQVGSEGSDISPANFAVNRDLCLHGLPGSGFELFEASVTRPVIRVPVAIPDTPDLVPEAFAEGPPAVLTPEESVDLNNLTLGSPANGTFACRSGTATDGFEWSYVAASPAGYVIGNCYDGWRVDRTLKSDLVDTEHRHYDGGYLYGAFDGCGWLPEDHDVQTRASNYSTCSDPSHATSSFAYQVNCKPHECSDGAHALTTSTCDEYANVRPWTPALDPSGYLRAKSAFRTVMWRYVTRDRAWVNVRDPDTAGGQGNWVFVRRSCLGALIPSPGNHLWYP